MNDSLPYRVSYAAEKRKCEKCRHIIRQGALEIAIMVQSNEDDCQYPMWYHQDCFFKVRLPSTEATFDGFAQLRYDHQLAIKKDLGIGDIDQTGVADEKNLRDFVISYAGITEATCIACKSSFKPGDLRIMRVFYAVTIDENQNDERKSGQANWYHVNCFVLHRSEIGWLCSGSLLPGFKRLLAEDKKMIQHEIPNIVNNSLPHEKQIQMQNDEYFKVYDYIVENVPKADRIEILQFNKQMVPDTDAKILHHLTDVIYFGALQKCKNCKTGQLVFDNWIYKCTKKYGWSICGNEDKDPPRLSAKMPSDLLAKYKFLQQQCGVRKRALHSSRFVDEQGNDLVYAPYKKPLLFNMEFVLVGTFNQPRANIEQLIKKLGGKVGTEIHDRVAAIISTANEVRKMDKQMQEARGYKIQVVDESFLNEIQKPDMDPISYIVKKSICNWGGDPNARIEENDVATRRETSFYTKSLPVKITLKWKDGTAVDPECGLGENVHVHSAMLNKKKVYYSVILGLVDIERNKNSYYRMQLLQSNDQNSYWVFESWGRIDTIIGSKCLKTYGKLDDALDKFHSVFKDKTGNNFDAKVFQKRPNKFYRLNGEVGMPRKMVKTMIPTKLNAPVFDLMQIVFDIEKMEDIMCGCDLDLKQMPLGKISADQIKKAMQTLKSIVDLIEENATVQELRDASNKFYTLVPHTFGVKRVPIIDTIEAATAKNELLESLLNMGIAYGFLEEENGEKVHPFDACYRKLKANIEPIAKDSETFRLFYDIVQKDNGLACGLGFVEVLEIFKVVRDEEDDRFQKQLSNHKLLWHGSRRTNFASILSNGLKIAPPEAPTNGYRFGKGIYFADYVSLSAHFCFADPDNDIGLMLLCEVALGSSKKMTTGAFNVGDMPNAEHQSIMGVGQYAPTGHAPIDGLSVPHSLALSNSSAQWAFNEYVVYDPTQVKIKYLFLMKFPKLNRP